MKKNGNKSLILSRVWRKYLRLTRGRIPAIRALEVITMEESDSAVKLMLTRLTEGVSGGLTLSEAAEKHARFFSPSVLELLRYAEKTGAWDDILTEIADGLAEGTFSH